MLRSLVIGGVGREVCVVGVCEGGSTMVGCLRTVWYGIGRPVEIFVRDIGSNRECESKGQGEWRWGENDQQCDFHLVDPIRSVREYAKLCNLALVTPWSKGILRHVPVFHIYSSPLLLPRTLRTSSVTPYTRRTTLLAVLCLINFQ
jgi:hypothetical protein